MKKWYVVSIYMLSISMCTIASQEWIGLDKQASLYAPALFQSQASTVCYCGRYMSPSGITFRSRKGYETLHPDHTYSFDFSEIAIDRSTVQQSWAMTLLLDLFRAGKYTFLAFLGDIRMPRGVWSDPLTAHAFDYTKVNIGQKKDLECLARAYEDLACDKDLVLYGFSRGAATICNFLCTQYTDQAHQRVKAAVLSGCFDSMESVFTQQAWRSFFLPASWGKSMCRTLEWMLPSFGLHRVEPIDVIAQFPKDVPVLFISSQQDAVVPSMCTKNLVQVLVRAGHKHVYYLELTSGAHARHYLNNAEAKSLIDAVVHAFYKSYGCAYAPELAEQGATLLPKLHCAIDID